MTIKQIIQIKNSSLGNVEHTVSVRKIGEKYHCRVFVNGEVNQEAVCDSKHEINTTCRMLLRWEDKCGNISEFASAARHR